MSFPPTTQTIWEGDERGTGTVRRIQASGDGSYLTLKRAVLDGEKWWQATIFAIKNREQAIAVRMAIDTYLETPLPPALQQTGIEMAKEAWAVLQAANRLVRYCRSVRLDTKLSPDPDDGELKCWQMEGWCLGLLEEADRVAALIDGVVEPIEPVPPRGGNPIKWDAKHFPNPGIELMVELGTLATLDNPVWVVSDEFGEEIVVTLMGLTWLAELFPQLLTSYRSDLKLHE
jgi:hypothetical protein